MSARKGGSAFRALRTQNADVGLIVTASRELAALPRDAAAARERWTREMRENYERARPLGGLAPAQPGLCGRPARHARRAARLRTDAPQLPGAHVLPDGGHGRLAAPAHALLHLAHGVGGAGIGGVVAVFHRLAVPERARRWRCWSSSRSCKTWWAAVSRLCPPGWPNGRGWTAHCCRWKT